MNRMAAGNLEPPRGLDARILIVDDQRTNIVVLSAVLQTTGATNVATETSPHLVIDRVLNWQPDLVLLDLHMPGKSGYELLEELEAIDAPTLPMVIVVTADDTQEATRQALRLGANDLLIKPLADTEPVPETKTGPPVIKLALVLLAATGALAAIFAANARDARPTSDRSRQGVPAAQANTSLRLEILVRARRLYRSVSHRPRAASSTSRAYGDRPCCSTSRRG